MKTLIVFLFCACVCRLPLINYEKEISFTIEEARNIAYNFCEERYSEQNHKHKGETHVKDEEVVYEPINGRLVPVYYVIFSREDVAQDEI